MPWKRFILWAGVTLNTSLGATPASWQMDAEVSWHDNVTNAERPEDLLSALQWRTELDAGFVRSLRDGHRVEGSAGLRVEKWSRFDGLDFAAPTLSMAWKFKPGLGPYRPVFVAELDGEWRLARESDRGGLGGAGRLSVRQRAGAAWVLLLGHEWQRFDAKGRAFDRTGREWAGRLEWNPGTRWALATEARDRFGDVVSYSRPPRPDLEAIGKPITTVDTFEQQVPWLAYYFKARTRSLAIELRRSFGRQGLILRHEYRETLHAGPGYKNQVTTIRYLLGF